jgi:hypothetical protein
VSQSYSLLLRDVLFDATMRLPFFVGFTTRKTRFFPIQKEHLPVIGVYLIDETMTPDGLPNMGCIRFGHTARIGFSVVILNNDAEEAERTLDRAFMALMDGLWRNPYLTNMLNTYQPSLGLPPTLDNIRFESIRRGVRTHSFGTAGQNNETPTAELRYDVSLFYTADYAPTIEDDLLEVGVTSAYPHGATEAERAGIQQVRQEIVFTPAAPLKEKSNG